MKTTSIFDVVKVARNEPKRYGKKGELLLTYDESEAHRIAERRRGSSVAKGGVAGTKRDFGGSVEPADDSSGDRNGSEKV